MTVTSYELRVAAIRSRGRNGGVIFTALTDRVETSVVVCDFRQIPDASLVEKGQRWLVAGRVQRRKITPKNGQEPSVYISMAS
jgi:hypothetical protein